MKQMRHAGRLDSIRLVLVVVVLSILLPSSAFGQLFQRATVLRHARLVTMRGFVIQDGTLIIKGDRIAAVGGPQLKAPFFAKTIDCRGKTVTPGLIDLHSQLAMTGGSRSPNATFQAMDAFDRYAWRPLREALRQGVTAMYLTTRGAPGIHGRGAIVRLVPVGGSGGAGKHGAFGVPLVENHSLEIDLDAGSPLSRVKTYQSVRKLLKKAKEYRKTKDDYEEQLAEYKRRIAARAKKKDALKKRPAGGKKKGTEETNVKEKEKEKEKGEEKEKEKEKENGIKKPERPRRQPQLEAILPALERKMPARVRARRSADILNALDLAEEFSLEIVLVEATEAHLVAKEIKAAGARVVLGSQLRTALYRGAPHLRRRLDIGRRLSAEGIEWGIGSGGDASARFVAMNAQLAAGAATGRSPATAGIDALRLVTSAAARVLNAEDRMGTLGRQRLADVVVWSGDPRVPGSHVEQVFVGGQLAYQREKDR